MPEREVLHYIDVLSEQRARFRTLKSRLRLAQKSQDKTKCYLEYHSLADTGSARYAPNYYDNDDVRMWWKQIGEEMGVYFDGGDYPRCPFAAVRSYLDKALEHVDPGLVGTVFDIVKALPHSRIPPVLRYSRTPAVGSPVIRVGFSAK